MHRMNVISLSCPLPAKSFVVRSPRSRSSVARPKASASCGSKRKAIRSQARRLWMRAGRERRNSKIIDRFSDVCYYLRTSYGSSWASTYQFTQTPPRVAFCVEGHEPFHLSKMRQADHPASRMQELRV